MGTRPPAHNELNLVCPNCGYQFRKLDKRSFNTTNYPKFVRNFSCSSCDSDIHPEDALVEYFEHSPTLEITGRPTKLGGFRTIGTKSVLVGKTEKIEVFGSDGLDIELILLAETNQPPGLSTNQLHGVQFDFYPGPIILNDSTTVNMKQVSDTEVEFITSKRNLDGWDVTFGYSFNAYFTDIPQPPWTELLSGAIENFHQAQGLAMYSLLFSSFESFLSREIARTLRATGWTEKPINDFLGYGKYWNWKDRCKDAIEVITSEHLPTKHPTLYQDLCEIKDVRDNQIIHIDHGGQVANITIQELRDSFEIIIEMMIAIHNICYNKRQTSKYPLGA